MPKTLEDEIKDIIGEGSKRPADKDGKLEVDALPVKDAGYVDTGGPKPTDSTHAGQQAAMGSEAAKGGGAGPSAKSRKADKKGAKFEDDKLPVKKEEKEDADNKDDDKKEKKDSKKKETKEESFQLTDHINAMFDGETLSDDFKKKATAIFEAAIKQQVDAIKEQMETEYSKKLEEGTAEVEKTISEKVDSFLDFTTQEWVKENKLALESSLRAEFAEEFISGLKNLFESFYVDVPEGKEDILKTTSEKVETLEKSLKEATDKNVETIKALNESQKALAVKEVIEGLVETDKDKLTKLVEGIEFTTIENYREKLKVLKESHFKKASEKDTSSKDINEETHKSGDTAASQQISGAMSEYLSVMEKMSR